jgi:hypothetical protein
MARRTAQTKYLLAGLLLVGCNDSAVKAFNASPLANITTHSAGDDVLEGYAITFRGSVSDSDHGPTLLETTWYLGGEEICPPTPPDSSGLTECVAVLALGDDVVSMEVYDENNARGSDSVSLNVIATESPVAVVSSPVDSGVYYSDQSIVFQGSVSDGETPNGSLEAWWESDIQGVLSVTAVPDELGQVSGQGSLQEGLHTITLTAQDESGKTGSAMVLVTVNGSNTSPSCGITAPIDGSAGELGDLVVFEAQVSDPDISADQLLVEWSSDKDGPLGSGSVDSSGRASLPISNLSQDTHLVSLDVTDDAGASCSGFILYTVGVPPAVAITSPLWGAVLTQGETSTFTADVSDDQDQPYELQLEWSSDLDGSLSVSAANALGAA